jgi:tRNA pseudouridine38-40 synthase
VSEDNKRLSYEVIGKSFMYKQVRNMVGVLVAVGMGKMSSEEIGSLLQNGRREPIQGAPAQGLTLMWVEHREESEVFTPVAGPSEGMGL